MKINYKMKLGKKAILILILITFSNCKNENKTELNSKTTKIQTESTKTESDSTEIKKEEIKKINTVKIEDIEYILENINDDNKISEKISELDFKKKLNGIYISKLSEMNSKPISWITITNMGLGSMVSFKTSQVKYFDDLIENIKSTKKTKEIRTNQFQTKLIGKKYTYEIYKPKNGINTSMNEYDEIIIYRTK